MKKLFAVVAIVGMLAGCTAFTNVMRGIKNGLAKTEQVLCSPTVDQLSDAVAALAFLKVFPGAAEGMATAVAVFSAIRDRICVSIPQLQEALVQFDQVVLVVQGQAAIQARLKAAVPAVKTPSLNSLRIAAHK